MGDVINQSTIWKFVGRVSAITGVVCFGLSSTYDMSFGKLGYGGPLVYLFVCSFMWFLMIWSKRILFICWFIICSKSSKEEFMNRGKMIQVKKKVDGVVGAILFVVICSISVVYKKYVPEKSDAYAITSYGSFALMSVFLSRKLELGFVTGLSAFFLKLFAAQLLKIKWFLLPIALVFCSLVIILRHYPESRSQNSTDMGKGSGQGLSSTSKERNSQEESSQAIKEMMVKFRSLIEDGNIEGLSTALSELEMLQGVQEAYIDRLETEQIGQEKVQVSSEKKKLTIQNVGTHSYTEAPGVRRRPTNIQNKQEEGSTSSSLAPRESEHNII